MKGVGSIPPPSNEALHLGNTRGLLQKKANDRLEARLLDIDPSFEGEKVVQFHYLIGVSPTNIRG